jgi:hypothetical protein
MTGAFDYEADVALSRKIDASLNMFGLACIDNVDGISYTAARILWIWQAGVIAPIILPNTDRVF